MRGQNQMARKVDFLFFLCACIESSALFSSFTPISHTRITAALTSLRGQLRVTHTDSSNVAALRSSLETPLRLAGTSSAGKIYAPFLGSCEAYSTGTTGRLSSFPLSCMDSLDSGGEVLAVQAVRDNTNGVPAAISTGKAGRVSAAGIMRSPAHYLLRVATFLFCVLFFRSLS